MQFQVQSQFGGLRNRIWQNGLRNRTQDFEKHKIGVFRNFDFWSKSTVNADVSKVNADVITGFESLS